ncbi:hypothetical protein [Singulisphaera sp. PoT]|uniref:hypothetical protein n=1 Tax=Singulisphaera sp. PoT TaxID=3411797 RepID=UPI003BF479F5
MAFFTPRFERKSTTVPGPKDVPLTCEIIRGTTRRWRRSYEAREEPGRWSVHRIGPRVIATM